MDVVSNSASNKALEDFGNQYEGVHRNMQMKQDEYYDYNKIVEENDMVITSVLSSEWPLLRRIVEEWMDDSNVDQNGQPIQQYEDIRNRVFAEANVTFRNTPEIYKTPNTIPERYRYYPLPRLPDKKILDGIYVKLEPLEQWHFDSLYQTIGNPNDVQNFSLSRPKKWQRDFGAWYMKDHDWASKYCYAIIDKNNNHVYGWMRFCDIIVDHGTLGIKAHLNKQYLQSPRMVEAIYMLCRYAFDILKYRRLEWVVNNNNVPAKDFVQRHGFLFESILRQYKIKDGENIDAAVFAITDVDWSKLRSVYEEWLAKVQFSDDGNDFYVRNHEKYKL
uniref:N-acetyltransferase domain-containing protein n=1 Tax=Acrobeloides nanus TaxID=290746 RepID=A0A914D2L1_9BILA